MISQKCNKKTRRNVNKKISFEKKQQTTEVINDLQKIINKIDRKYHKDFGLMCLLQTTVKIIDADLISAANVIFENFLSRFKLSSKLANIKKDDMLFILNRIAINALSKKMAKHEELEEYSVSEIEHQILRGDFTKDYLSVAIRTLNADEIVKLEDNLTTKERRKI